MAKHVVEQKGVKSDMLMNKHTSVEPNLIYIPFPGLKFASLLRRKTSAALRWHIHEKLSTRHTLGINADGEKAAAMMRE